MQIRAFALSFLLLASGFAQAASVIYLLGDHPDAALYKAGGDPYGIRYDAAAPPGSGPTFSVGTNLGGLGGPVTLTWDPLDLSIDAVISGTVVRDDDDTVWTVIYTLSGLAAAADGGFTATSGTGSLDEVGGALRSIALTGEANGSGIVFEFDDDGHRLPTSDGWSGRGWLFPAGSTDDWLVTGTIIPLPAAVWFFGGGLLSLVGMRIGARSRD